VLKKDVAVMHTSSPKWPILCRAGR